MPTAASTLIQRTRRLVRDFPELDSLTASDPSDLSSGALTKGSLASAPTTKATLSAD
jgi:hypothetical protein